MLTRERDFTQTEVEGSMKYLKTERSVAYGRKNDSARVLAENRTHSNGAAEDSLIKGLSATVLTG